jgi:hypothetical protein
VTAVRSRLLVAVLGLQLLVLLPGLISPGVMRAPASKVSEVTGQTFPWHEFWRDEVRAGRPPFWNPFIFAGTPMIGEPQAQLFYPGQLLWLALPAELAYKMWLLLHLWLGAWLMYRLVRELGADRFGASVAALAFGLHGQIVVFAYTGWVQMIAPMAWAPGVIWQLVRALRREQRWPAGPIAMAGLLLGIQFLSGHPEWVRYTLAIGLIVTLGGRALRRSLVERCRIAAMIVVLGVLIGAVQLAPLAQATTLSDRGVAALAGTGVAPRSGLPLLSLPTVIAPRLFGPWDLSITTDGLVHKLTNAGVSYGETLIFIGVLPLFCALLARRRSARSGVAVWMAVAGVGLLFAANDVTHAQTLFDKIVPIDAAFRSPGRFVFMTNFALIVLAGLGASQLTQDRGGVRTIARLALGSAAVLGVATAVLWMTQRPLTAALLSRLSLPPAAATIVPATSLPQLAAWAMSESLRQLAMAAVMLAASAVALRLVARRGTAAAHVAVLALVTFDLGAAGLPLLSSDVHINDVRAADHAVLAPLENHPDLMLNTTQPSGLSDENVVIPLHVRALRGYQSFRIAESSALTRALDALPMARAALAGATHMLGRGPDGQLALTPLADSRPRAWWTDGIRVASSSDAAIALLLQSPAIDDAVVETASGLSAHTALAPATPVTIERDLPGRIRLDVNQPQPGWVVLCESYYPGWIARVNGAPVRLVRAFGVFQAIEVPAGRAVIDIEFRPRVVWIGAATTAVGLFTAMLMIAGGCRRKTNVP